MGRKTFFTDSAIKNNRTYSYYFRTLTEIAISMFEWTNLPDSVDERFLELTLYNDGQAVFFEDEVMGYLALQNITQGRLNIYRVPIFRRAFAVNGYQRKLDENNSVIIYNNMLRMPCVQDIARFAERLYQLDSVVDVNAQAQKTPILIRSTAARRLTLENLYKEYAGNSPVIYGDKSLDPDSLKVLKTDAPFVADKIYQLKVQIWNEALTYLGIPNINTQKKERMITDEVSRQLGGTYASRFSRLNMRKQAAERINKMFGLNIGVRFRLDELEQEMTGQEESGVGQNE